MTHTLFDMTALAHSRHRARKSDGSAMFLHRRAIEQVTARLAEVNRTFTRPAIVTAFPEIWAECLPNATLVDEAELLDLQPGGHDLIVHALSLHWSNDPVGQMIQCRLGLVPDGLFLGVLFGGQTLHELRASMAEAEIELKGGLSPRVAPMAELRDLGGLLQRAGFALPVADSDRVDVTFRSLVGLLHDLRAMGEVNVVHERLKSFSSSALFGLISKVYAVNFTNEMSVLNATFEMMYLTGWAPDASQPKPLRPGSAAMRLQDALNDQKAGEE